MSRPPAVSCEGAPRDLGHDQGAFARHAVAAALRGAPRPGLRGRVLPDPNDPELRLGRDLRRFFPHMSERGIGLARGAGVSQRALFGLLERHAGSDSGATLAAGGGPIRVMRAIAHPTADLLLRRSGPGESDFRSVELALPGIVPALVGVNEHGLAVSASWSPASPALTGPRASAAPAQLLAQDCLQRFDAVAAALEWCERRPAGGPTTLVLADAAGDLASIHVFGDERRIVLPEDGVLVAPQGVERARRLHKAAVAEPQLDVAGLHRALDAAGEPRATRVVIEAGAARLGLCASDGLMDWVEL